ncbi:hypothetical protein L873DRAFT_1786506 [Choiromyces venosus 120613-1]|uniref:G-patch domain-containing protein n=1 Tax=Choiromyces venosus 120613-1 TaxID=1336337 RepID=A0A3N4K1U6_9PEZI|nr:hypothetical protein L873DRAFT_1786506 [Choiromyces venosus 120613-1]
MPSFMGQTDHEEEEEEEAPDWRTQAPYGSGIRRKRVAFVPASDSADLETVAPKPSKLTGSEASSLYLSLVGLSSKTPSTSTSTAVSSPSSDPEPSNSSKDLPICEICSLLITDEHTHEKSTAHQYALPHSHPPHHYDRSSLGLKVLMDSGWDPDERKGLGKEGEGMRYPIKPVPKHDNLGVGVKRKKGGKKGAAEEKVKKVVGVKEARKMDTRAKARRANLMREMGGGIDVEAILNGKS